MKLPQSYREVREWSLIGPMGPVIRDSLLNFPIIGVDGGADFSEKLDIWVGDGDSLKKNLICDHQFLHPQDKALSDLGLALSFFSHPLKYKLHLWGFHGGRIDHELFNLGESLTFLEQKPGSEILIYGPGGEVIFHLMAKGEWKLNHQGLFSLGVLKDVMVKLTGHCKYQLPEKKLIAPLSSLGLSNHGQGEFTLYNEGPVFIHYPDVL